MPLSQAQTIARLRTQVHRLKETLKEYEQLWRLQRTRMDEATKLWQKATGKYHVLPDLGDLLEWLLSGKRGKKNDQP